MNIWSKMLEMLTGLSSDPYNETRALDLIDEEIRRNGEKLDHSRDELAHLMAQTKLSEKQLEAQQQQIDEHENYVREALNQNNEPLALEIAEKIVELETVKVNLAEIHQGYIASVKNIQHIIQLAELELARMKQQVATLKATDSVQQAQAVIAKRHKGSQTAQQALARIKEKQSRQAVELDHSINSDDNLRRDSLNEKLREAGINTNSPRAKEIISKIKQVDS